MLPDVPEYSRRDSRDSGAQGGRASAPTGISTPREVPQASINFAAVTSQVLVAASVTKQEHLHGQDGVEMPLREQRGHFQTVSDRGDEGLVNYIWMGQMIENSVCENKRQNE